ncbi:hypothetical protein D3C80_1679480 [compost metagenome]
MRRIDPTVRSQRATAELVAAKVQAAALHGTPRLLQGGLCLRGPPQVQCATRHGCGVAARAQSARTEQRQRAIVQFCAAGVGVGGRQQQLALARFDQALAIPTAGKASGWHALIGQCEIDVKRGLAVDGEVAGTLGLPAIGPGQTEAQFVIIAQDVATPQQIILGSLG